MGASASNVPSGRTSTGIPARQRSALALALSSTNRMKISAIASRGSRKDFIDLHYMIKHFLRLDDYLQLYMKKYENRDIGHVVRSLVYFADAEAEPDIITNYPLLWEDLRRDFEKWVTNLQIK